MITKILTLGRTGALAPMGSGKTAAVLTAIDFLKLFGHLTGKVLVVAPVRVAQSTWPDEIATWPHLAELDIVSVTGTAPQRLKALREDADIYTINFENLQWLEKQLGGKWPFEMLVVDENKLKNFRIKQGGTRAKVLGKYAFNGVKYFVQLSGTPAGNGLQDVWGFNWFIDRGARLGASFTAFQDRWFRKKPYTHGWEPMPFAKTEIPDALRDTCFYLEPKGVEKPIVTLVPVTLPPKAMQQYKAMEKTMFAELKPLLAKDAEHSIEAVNPAVKCNKCLQLANGAGYIEGDNKEWVEIHDQKIQALESIIEEAAGMPVLVAYHFKSDLVRLKKAFPQGRALDKNPKTIRDWNEGRIPVMFVHPASAGHGISLQHGGNIIAFFSLDWSLENHMQVIERIGPQRQKQSGYDRPVYVYYILAEKTVDYTVLERLETKRSVQEILLQTLKIRIY